MRPYLFIIILLTLIGCQSAGQWQFDGSYTVSLSIERDLAAESAYIYPCSARSAVGVFRVTFADRRIEEHSFCASQSDFKKWGRLALTEDSQTICFWKPFYDDHGDFVGGGVILSDCHTFSADREIESVYADYYQVSCRDDISGICVEADISIEAAQIEELFDLSHDYHRHFDPPVGLRVTRTDAEYLNESIYELVSGVYAGKTASDITADESVTRYRLKEGRWQPLSIRGAQQ